MTARPRLSEEQRQQRELNARRDLEQLVEHLVGAAHDAWQDQRLWGTGDRARYFGRSADLITAVDKLSKMILEHPDADVRTDRLNDLHDMIFAVAFIAPCLKTPAAGRQRTIAAAGVNLTENQRRQQDENEVILEVTEPIRQRHPTEGPYQIAPKATKEIKERLEARNREGLAEDTIARRLTHLWARRAPPPEN